MLKLESLSVYILCAGLGSFNPYMNNFTLQASELRAYIKSKGADISEENSEGGLHIDLAQIIEACDVCLKDEDKGK